MIRKLMLVLSLIAFAVVFSCQNPISPVSKQASNGEDVQLPSNIDNGENTNDQMCNELGTVTNYAINHVVEIGPGEIFVEAQANFCTGCNPNAAGHSGCTPFEHSLPPYGQRTCTHSSPDGTYIAVRIIKGGSILQTQETDFISRK